MLTRRSTLRSQYCSYVSDAGQRINAMHGARRTDGYPGVPERVFAEQYKVCVENKEGHVARDAISCRKQHRSSATGHFTGGFDDEGNPKKRVGYVVTCSKDSDCRTRCPIHPLSGEVRKQRNTCAPSLHLNQTAPLCVSQHYYCQKIYSLYGVLGPNHTHAHL